MIWTCTCGTANQDGQSFCSQCGAARPTPTATLPEGLRGAKGPSPSSKKKIVAVVAILCAAALVGLCVLGIVAAIAVPAIIKGRGNAKERAKQSRAMQEMREMADLAYRYRSKHGRYPNWGNRDKGFHLYDEDELCKLVYEDMQNHGITIGVDFYDPWNNKFQYGVNGSASEFVIICRGSDGTSTLERVPDQHVGTHCFEDDIIWLNDGFIQEPEGSQKKCQ